MKVFFYGIRAFEFAEILLGMIRTTVPEDQLEAFQNMNEMKDKLHQLTVDDKIGVFCISTVDELIELLNVERLLRRMKVILVLGFQEDERVTLAHRVRPRYLAYANEHPCQILEVIEKMLIRSEADR